MNPFLIPLIILAVSLSPVFGQSKVDLRLIQQSHQANKSCYDMEMRSPFKENIDLAGQNYRVFYDAQKARVIKSSVQNYVSRESYGPLEVIVTEQDDIGFLSLSVDGKAYNEHTLTIPNDGSWIKVASACFQSILNEDYDIVWANERTAQFASAQVALSKWETENEQKYLQANLMIDHMGNGFALGNDELDISVYPNPIIDLIRVKVDDKNSKANTILIKDVIGREVATDDISGLAEFSYDLSNWPSGRYTVELLDKSGSILRTKSVIKAYNN